MPRTARAAVVRATDIPPTANQPTPDGILKLGLSFWSAKALLSAVELGLFTHLARKPRTLQELVDHFDLHIRGARDFFDALVALNLLERSDGRYANTEAADLFLDKEKPSYVGGILEMANARLYPFWGGLTEALRSGLPQNEAKQGQNFFEVLYADPRRLEAFLRAMTGISLGAAHAIAQKFPWADYRSFADIGCAQGGVPVALAQAHPDLSGIGYDLPAVRPIFEKYVKEHGLSQRIRFQAGNFLEEEATLPEADVLIMGHILHDWNLDQKRELIEKAYDALPRSGALIIYEALIDDERRTNAFGLLMSLNMLIETPGGFDYTGADCIGWLREAGFRETRVEHLIGPDSMVVAIK